MNKLVYLPNVLNFVKKVGDLKLISGTSSMSKKKGTVCVTCQTCWKTVFVMSDGCGEAVVSSIHPGWEGVLFVITSIGVDRHSAVKRNHSQ